jgi:transcriptional regulator with XRE-family HTH domain
MSKPIREYVLIPKDEYERLTKASTSAAVDAITYARASLARDLLAARKAAGFTQSELAKRLRISQSLVSQAEQGKVKVGERYAISVLRACRLPRDWAPPPTSRKTLYPRGDDIAAANVITLRERSTHVRFERSSAGLSTKRRSTSATKRARSKAAARHR